MVTKILYRLVYNYGNRLTQAGNAPVALECRQGARKIYLSSKVRIEPHQWQRGKVVNHPNQEKLTVYLHQWRHQIEEVELDALLKGTQLTLMQLKNAVRNNAHPKATIREFTESVIIPDTSRSKGTKNAYRGLIRELESNYGSLTLDDITYDFLVRWRNALRRRNLSENTVKGKLKSLRCIVNEALKRDIITYDAFKNITIGTITARKEYLSEREVRRIETVQLKGREAHVRDAFLFCCCCGLRFSDFRSLKSTNLIGDILSLKQKKTRNPVNIPLRHLFQGKPLEILNRYSSVESFARIPTNATTNHILKDIAKKARVDKNLHFHLSRKACANKLNIAGLQINEVSKVLGHQKSSTTEMFYLNTTAEQVDKSLKKAFKTPPKSVQK